MNHIQRIEEQTGLRVSPYERAKKRKYTMMGRMEIFTERMMACSKRIADALEEVRG